MAMALDALQKTNKGFAVECMAFARLASFELAAYLFEHEAEDVVRFALEVAVKRSKAQIVELQASICSADDIEIASGEPPQEADVMVIFMAGQ